MKDALRKLFLDEHFVLILIFLNSVLIFIQDFDNIPVFVSYLDQLFTALFTIEMVVKIDYYGFPGYWKNNWNKFDFIVVVTALLSLLVDLVDIHHTLPLQYILILRVFRLFKSFRIFRFMPDIDSIIKGLQRAVKASYVITFAFLVLLVILSVLTCSIFKNLAPEYFGTPLESLYSMFRLFSADSWYEVSDLIASRSTPAMAVFTKIYFILLLFFASILGVSLINSIFVDAMVSNSSDRVEEKVNILHDKVDSLLKQSNSPDNHTPREKNH
ncbi:MAG: ion transporter [Tannerellaceae bacterium]|nr:ion transporter [Tannerellaceae bacterium]